MFEWFKKTNGDRLAQEGVVDYERGVDDFDVIRKLKQALAIGLENYPADRAYTFLGAAYENGGMEEEAAAVYVQALSHNPENATALSNLGAIRQRQDADDEALDLYRRAIRANPRSGFAHNNVGMLHYARGRFEQAKPFLASATQLNPGLSTAFANLARCCAHLGAFAEAELAFQEATRSGYAGAPGLQKELRDLRATFPKVYFDEDSFFAFAAAACPNAEALARELRMSIDHPRELYATMVARDQVAFLSDHVVTHALPWVVLCDALEARGVAFTWVARSARDMVESVLRSARAAGIDCPPPSALATMDAVESSSDDDAAGILDMLADELRARARARVLLVSEGPVRDLVCVVDDAAWSALCYPYTRGEDGYGLVRPIGGDTAVERAVVLHS